MFGHEDGQDEVAVDASLASDLDAVEASVASYLKDPSAAMRNQLLVATGSAR